MSDRDNWLDDAWMIETAKKFIGDMQENGWPTNKAASDTDDFDSLLSGAVLREDRAASEARGAQMRSDSEASIAVAAEESQFKEGLSPRAIFGEKTPLAMSFLETMDRKGFPFAHTIRFTQGGVSREGMLGRMGLGRSQPGRTVDGYLVGRTKMRSRNGGYTDSRVFLCEDSRIRVTNEEGTNYPGGVFDPMTDGITFGHNVRRRVDSLDNDRDSRPRKFNVLEFKEMPLDQVLVDIAQGRAPHQL